MIRNLALTTGLILLFFSQAAAQRLDDQIQRFEAENQALILRQKQLIDTLEGLKLQRIRRDLHVTGLPALRPGEQLIEHAAYMLVYDEQHEQAAWVAHVIVPEVIKGNVSRTNDFRPDPLVRTGTAVEKDYFLKYPQEDGSFEYDGFGYDRGHLAPSADFRWSQQALSESYYYSNMSPQVPDLNRRAWAELESMLRGYMYRHPNTQLFVVSGPVLHDGLPKIERSVNGVSIPEQYFKVVLDLNQQRAIAFLMPNKEVTAPLETFAISVDAVEQLTGLDFFHALPDYQENLWESQVIVKPWLPDNQQDDVRPLKSETLPPAHFNTVTARTFGEFDDRVRVNICGTVVSTKLTSKGHIFLNLDKKFPNQIFTAAIWKDNRVNFSYEPHLELAGKCVCVEGSIRMSRGTPTMEVRGEESVKLWDPRFRYE